MSNGLTVHISVTDIQDWAVCAPAIGKSIVTTENLPEMVKRHHLCIVFIKSLFPAKYAVLKNPCRIKLGSRSALSSSIQWDSGTYIYMAFNCIRVKMNGDLRPEPTWRQWRCCNTATCKMGLKEFLAATKQLYKWYFPSLCLPVCYYQWPK